MDPTVIAAAVIALLRPFVSQAVDSFAGEAGRAVWSKTASLFGRLRARFATDKAAQNTLEKFAADPNGEAERLNALLVEMLQTDKEFASQLAAALTDIKQTGPKVVVVQEVEKAESLVGVEAGKVTRGTVDVTQRLTTAKDVTGAKLGDLG